MKFGSVIKSALCEYAATLQRPLLTLSRADSEWQDSYVDYSGLKKFIKDRQDTHKWDDGDEADFVKALEGELDKVVKFQEAKVRVFLEMLLLQISLSCVLDHADH